MKKLLKKLAFMSSAVTVSPLVALCKLHQKLDPGFDFYHYGYIVGLLPGEIGKQLRRAFYQLTLERCGHSLSMEFGSYFVAADTEVGDHFHCGAYCIIGRSNIEDFVMLASRCSVLSGLAQHGYDDLETPMLFQEGEEGRVNIGRNVWIGEGAIVGADVGENTIVGVGSVTTRPTKPNTVVLGNPARVIRHRVAGGSPFGRAPAKEASSSGGNGRPAASRGN